MALTRFMLALVLKTSLLTTSTSAWIVFSSARVFGSRFSSKLSMSSSQTPPKTLRVLGICGGIGSGKSRACQLLVENSKSCIAHLEADTIAHAVYTPGSKGLEEISQEFGSHIIQQDGNVNRKELGAIVFADPSKMAKLERIVWPYVKQEIQAKLEELRQEYDSGVVVLEAAVLLDAGWDDIMDAVWVVTTPTPIALERLVSNRNFTRQEAQKRIDAQEFRRGIGNLNDEVANGVVTRVIENMGTEEQLLDTLQQALQDPTAWKQISQSSTL